MLAGLIERDQCSEWEVSKSYQPELRWQGGPVYRFWGGGEFAKCIEGFARDPVGSVVRVAHGRQQRDGGGEGGGGGGGGAPPAGWSCVRSAGTALGLPVLFTMVRERRLALASCQKFGS